MINVNLRKIVKRTDNMFKPDSQIKKLYYHKDSIPKEDYLLCDSPNEKSNSFSNLKKFMNQGKTLKYSDDSEKYFVKVTRKSSSKNLTKSLLKKKETSSSSNFDESTDKSESKSNKLPLNALVLSYSQTLYENDKNSTKIKAKKCTVVKEYSYKDNQNNFYNSKSSSFSQMIDCYMNNESRCFVSLFEGHGNADLVLSVRKRFQKAFAKHIRAQEQTEKAFKDTFSETDNELKILPSSYSSGSTATVIYIHTELNNKLIYEKLLHCANLGDTRAVVINSVGVKRLSQDHNCSELPEIIRISNSGGPVQDGKLFGILNISRSLGDFKYKDAGLISEPFINKYVLNDDDKYVVICSKGVWDVLNEDELFEISTECENTDDFSDKILRLSFLRGSQDNLSCSVVRL